MALWQHLTQLFHFSSPVFLLHLASSPSLCFRSTGWSFANVSSFFQIFTANVPRSWVLGLSSISLLYFWWKQPDLEIDMPSISRFVQNSLIGLFHLELSPWYSYSFSFIHLAFTFIHMFYCVNYFSKFWISPYISCEMLRSLLFPLRCLFYLRTFLHFCIYVNKVNSISTSLIVKQCVCLGLLCNMK